MGRSCLTCISNSVQRTDAGSIGRPQFGLPRLLGMKVIAAPPDNTPPTSCGDLSRRMKKAPDPVRGLPHFLAGSVHNQAVEVRNFLIASSSFARNQSSCS